MRLILLLFFILSCNSPIELEDKICGTVYTEDDWYFVYTTYIQTDNKVYIVKSDDTELMYELNKLQMVHVCLYYSSIENNVITIYDYK